MDYSNKYLGQEVTVKMDRPMGSKHPKHGFIYPVNYGFIPNTLAEDGAPLDAMVIMEEPTFAGCLIKARPIGVLDMHDSGAYDGKLLCVPVADPRQKAISSIRQIAPNQLEDVAEFFRTYKSLEGRVIVIDGWRDYEAVDDLLESCITADRLASLSQLKD